MIIQAEITQTGEIKTNVPPFLWGKQVILTIALVPKMTNTLHYPLRNSVIRYDNPTEPAIPMEEWEVVLK